MALSVEEMKWKLFKVYPGGDWLADVDAWDDKTTQQKYRYYQSTGQIT